MNKVTISISICNTKRNTPFCTASVLYGGRVFLKLKNRVWGNEYSPMVYYSQEIDSLYVQLFTAVMVLTASITAFGKVKMSLFNWFSYLPLGLHIISIVTAILIFAPNTTADGAFWWYIGTWILIVLKDTAHLWLICKWVCDTRSNKAYAIVASLTILLETVFSVLGALNLFKGDTKFSYGDTVSRQLIAVQHVLKCLAEAFNVWIFYSQAGSAKSSSMIATLRDRGIRFQMFSRLMTVANKL